MPVRELVQRTWINDTLVRLVNTGGGFSRSQARGQGIGSCTLMIQSPPFDLVSGMRVRHQIGWDYDLKPRFTGLIINPRQLSYPRNRFIVQCADILYKADQVKQDITLDPVNDWNARAAAIELLTTYAGIDASLIALPELETAPGEPWILFQETPAAFTGGSVLSYVQKIYDPLGYWVYCDAGGIVRAVSISGGPTASVAHTYTEGQDLLVEGAPEIDRDIETIFNQVEVRGANTGVEGVQLVDEWQVEHPLLPTGSYHTLNYSNDLLEYINEGDAGAASITEVAKRLILEHSRNPLVARMRVKGDADLHTVGKAIGLNSSRLQVNQHFYIISMSETAGGADWSVQLTLDGGIGSQGYTTIPPPSAAFEYLTHQETLDGVDTIELFLDGGASTSPTGEIVSWEWTDDSSPTPQTAIGRWATLLYPASETETTITLTVTDTSSKEHSVTLTIQLAGDTIHTPSKRELTLAAGSEWYVTRDGGQDGWQSVSSGDAIAVPPIGPSGGLSSDPSAAATIGMLATGGSGGVDIRRTTDYLETAPTTLATLPGPVNFLWHNELTPTRVWAAVGDDVYRSLDGGATWTLAGTPASGQDVAWVQESPDQATLEVLAGVNVYWSTTGGATWSTVLDGPTGATARNYAAGFGRHWVGFTDVDTGAQPLRSVEGDISAFSATPEVLNIRALTMLVEQPILVAIDDTGRIWHVSAEDGSIL